MDSVKPKKNASLLSRRMLARNTMINILGLCLPLIVALFCTPMLIKGLGLERFGVLTIAWAFVGYFGIFELGIARAMTKYVAEKSSALIDVHIAQLIWTSITTLGIFGIIGSFAVAGLTPWIVNVVLKIPSNLREETLSAFYLLSLSVPFVTMSLGFKGVLEAYQRFDLTNLVRIPLGAMTFLGPVIILSFSNTLFAIISVLIFSWVIALICYFCLCVHIVPGLRSSVVRLHYDIFKKLAGFGSWITVSSIVGPLMVYMDRFLIGMLVSMVAVTYYTTPYEVATKLLFIPSALMAVLFPALTLAGFKDPGRTILLFDNSITFIAILLTPLVILSNTFAYEGLYHWLGDDFAQNSTLVFQLITTGVFFNAIAQAPYSLIQSHGRPDLTAKLHVAEAPFFLLILWISIVNYGIVGAAFAWMLRSFMDMIILLKMACKILSLKSIYFQKQFFLILAALLLMLIGSLLDGMVLKSVFSALALGSFFPFVIFYVLDANDRITLFDYFKNLKTHFFFN